jgi:hypothetical protein
MAFPTTNLSLSTVLQAYTGITTGSINNLRSRYYYTPSNPPSTLQQVGTTGSISLGLFLGKSVYTGPLQITQIITSTGPITFPPNTPLPVRFSFTLEGGGGGGGGGGAGGFHPSAIGGQGGRGGGGALININDASYSTSLPINISSLGSGGAPGGPNASGTSGGDTILTYNNVTYTAGGGGGGGLGGAGSNGPGAFGTSGNPGVASPSGTNGGVNNGGGGGPGGTPNNNGLAGFPGGPGSISITWYYI